MTERSVVDPSANCRPELHNN